MLYLPGGPALSSYRLLRLREQLQGCAPGVAEVRAQFVHFADFERPPSGDARSLLEQLVGGAPQEPTASASRRLVLVVPRLGTISPWSSKASDIARICGLHTLRRLERACGSRVV